MDKMVEFGSILEKPKFLENLVSGNNYGCLPFIYFYFLLLILYYYYYYCLFQS